LPLSWEVVEKRWVLGRRPRINGECIPQISEAHFKIALTSKRVASFG